MGKEEAFKIIYTLVWIFIASYYFWGAREETVTAPVDESGWVPDGAFATRIVEGGEAAQPAAAPAAE